MIIGINGYANSGKDTIGIIIQYLMSRKIDPIALPIEVICKDPLQYEELLEDSSGWEVRKFAGKLKDIASHLTGIDRDEFENQEFKKTVLGTEWWTPCDEGLQPMTVRDLLQKLGTECMRNGLHTNTWVNALMADYKDVNQDEDGFIHEQYGEYDISIVPNPILWSEYYPNWIITDTRFPNEAQAIKDRGGIIIRVDRPGVSPINAHPSETGLDNWEFDHKIVNLSDIVNLMFTVENILKHHKLL